MSPAAPIHPLPHIPERHLLRAVLQFDADLSSVAVFTSTPADEVIRWAHTEAVFAWIEAHTYFKSLAREHRELARATRTLDELEKLYKTTDDPVERRRILSAILRGGTAILRGRPAPAPAPARSEAPDRATDETPQRPHTPRPSVPKPPPPAQPAPSPPETRPQPSSAHALTALPAPAFDISHPPDLFPKPRPGAKRNPAHLLAAAGLPAP
jgi:hypothetical protein